MDDLTINISKLFRKEIEKTLNGIANDKLLDKNTLYDHYLKPNKYFNEIINKVMLDKKKKPNKRILGINEQCLGRKMDFTQCTRKRKDDTNFCGSHIKNLPNGLIGDNGECFNKVKKKRGRKRKDCLKAVNDDEFATTKVNIDNEDYLINKRNIVFSFKEENENVYPVIEGVLVDGKICEL